MQNEADVFDNRLHSALIAKTEGDAVSKVRTRGEGKGIAAYYDIHYWFSTVSGLAMTLLSLSASTSPKCL